MFTLWFFNGVFLKDEKEILAYIKEAIENEEHGKIIKQNKTEVTIVVPVILQKEFETDSNFEEAFLKFSLYKQREFLEYIETAKQDKTKLSRIEKIKTMIFNNIGLNDKYRQ